MILRGIAVLVALFALAPVGLARPATGSASPLTPALWDSLPPGDPSGAILRDEEEVVFSPRRNAYVAQRTLSRTLAIADTALWGHQGFGPDLLLPAGTQVEGAHLWILGPGGTSASAGEEAEILASADSCHPEVRRLRLRIPPVAPHTLLRWEVTLREDSGRVRTRHLFGDVHAVGESRFTLRFPTSILQTAWAHRILTYGAVPRPEVQRNLGPRHDEQVFTYLLRRIPPNPDGPFAPPPALRIPLLILLPGKDEAEGARESAALLDRFRKASVLGEDTSREILALAPEDSLPLRAERLYHLLQDRIRGSNLGLHSLGYDIRPAGETWRTGCGAPADRAALLTAALRALGLPARTALVRSVLAGPADSSSADPFQFDAILVHVPSARSGAPGLWCDPSCRWCAFGQVPAAFQGRPALTLEEGRLHWETLPVHNPLANWIQRTADLSLTAGSVPRVHGRFTISSFGDMALRERERRAGGGATSEGWIGARTAAGATLDSLRARGQETLEEPLVLSGALSLPLRSDTRGNWLLPEDVFRHEGLLPAGTARPEGILFPLPFLVSDSISVTLPPGWGTEGLPEPTALERPGIRFRSRASLESGRLVLSSLLVVEDPWYPPPLETDLLDLVRAVEAEDVREVRLMPPR